LDFLTISRTSHKHQHSPKRNQNQSNDLKHESYRHLGFYPKLEIIEKKTAEKDENHAFLLKMAWPPATHDVISRNHGILSTQLRMKNHIGRNSRKT